MLENEIDIYGDLEDFQYIENQKSKELQAWQDKHKTALEEIDGLKAKWKALNKKVKSMEMNFQLLLDTAKAEIKRKDSLITLLRKEKDDLCFRRRHIKRDEPASNVTSTEHANKSSRTLKNSHGTDCGLDSSGRGPADNTPPQERECPPRNKSPKPCTSSRGVSNARDTRELQRSHEKQDSRKRHRSRDREREHTKNEEQQSRYNREGKRYSHEEHHTKRSRLQLKTDMSEHSRDKHRKRSPPLEPLKKHTKGETYGPKVSRLHTFVYATPCHKDSNRTINDCRPLENSDDTKRNSTETDNAYKMCAETRPKPSVRTVLDNSDDNAKKISKRKTENPISSMSLLENTNIGENEKICENTDEKMLNEHMAGLLEKFVKQAETVKEISEEESLLDCDLQPENYIKKTSDVQSNIIEMPNLSKEHEHYATAESNIDLEVATTGPLQLFLKESADSSKCSLEQMSVVGTSEETFSSLGDADVAPLNTACELDAISILQNDMVDVQDELIIEVAKVKNDAIEMSLNYPSKEDQLIKTGNGEDNESNIANLSCLPTDSAISETNELQTDSELCLTAPAQQHEAYEEKDMAFIDEVIIEEASGEMETSICLSLDDDAIEETLKKIHQLSQTKRKSNEMIFMPTNQKSAIELDLLKILTESPAKSQFSENTLNQDCSIEAEMGKGVSADNNENTVKEMELMPVGITDTLAEVQADQDCSNQVEMEIEHNNFQSPLLDDPVLSVDDEKEKRVNTPESNMVVVENISANTETFVTKSSEVAATSQSQIFVTKRCSLGNSDYQFEQVNEEVVLRITRRRRRK